MPKASRVKQMEFTLPDKVGLLAEVTEQLKNTGVNIEALCVYTLEGTARFMIVVDNNAKASRALKKYGVKDIKYTNVLSVRIQNRPGSLNSVVKKIADAGINGRFVYCTAAGKGMVNCIISTEKDTRVLKLL
jgi:hypothetical protein